MLSVSMKMTWEWLCRWGNWISVCKAIFKHL